MNQGWTLRRKPPAPSSRLHEIEGALAAGHLLAFAYLEVVAEGGCETLLVVVGEDIAAGLEHPSDLRVCLGYKLDHEMAREAMQKAGHLGERNVIADREVVDHGEKEDEVGGPSVEERDALSESPAEGRARVSEVHDER